MASRAGTEAAAVAAGWKPLPNFTAEAVAITQKYPDLHLRVWALPDGVHLLAYVQHADGKGGWHVTEIARARWMPRSITEISVVEWGQKALSRWLERQLLPTEEQELRD